MIIARQSTARTVTVGPVLDASGVAVTTAAVGDFKGAVNGGAPAALNGSATLTHRHTGMYSLALTATDLGTVGSFEVTLDKTTDACPMKDITVLEEAVYDALFAASGAGYQVPIWSSAAATVSLTNTTVATVTTTTTATAVTTVNGLAAGVITAASIAADAITDAKVASDVTIASVTGAVGSVTGNVGGSVGSVTAGVTVTTNNDKAGYSVSGTTTTLDAMQAALNSAHGAGSWATATGFSTHSAADVWAVGARTLTSLSGLTVDTVTTLTNLPAITANWLTATGIAADAITAAKVASDVTIASVTGAVGSVTAGVTVTTNNDKTGYSLAVAPPTAAAVATAVWTDTTASDFTTALSVGKSLMNGVTLGTGLTVARCTLADTLTTYTGNTPQTGDSFARIGAAGAGLTAVPWNAAWDAEVQSEVQDAIEVNHLDHLLAADYDPASKPGVSTALLNELIGSDAGVSQFTANSLELAPTGGAAPTASAIADEVQTRTIAGVTLVATTTNLTNLPTIPANWLTAAGTAADFTTEIQTGLATAAALAVVDGIVDDILLDTAEIGAAGAGLTNINLPNQTMDIVGNITGNLSGSVGSLIGTVTLADASLTTAKLGTFALAKTTNITGFNDIAATAVVSAGAITTSAGKVSGVILVDTTTTNTDMITAAGVRTAVGLATANLDTQLDALPTNAELATALGTADDAVLAAIAALNNVSAASVATAVFTTAMTEAYRSAGATATLAQFVYEVIAHLGDSSITSTTKTLRKLDGSTAKTFTLDSASAPTSITETS